MRFNIHRQGLYSKAYRKFYISKLALEELSVPLKFIISKIEKEETWFEKNESLCIIIDLNCNL